MVCASEGNTSSLPITHRSMTNTETSFNNGYNTTELVDQELNFDQLQAINAGAASDDVMAVGATMVTCGGNLLKVGAALGPTGTVAGAVGGVGAVSFVGGMLTTFVGFGMSLFGA